MTMAEEDIYIAGLGPGVPEWSNEITQQQILDALRNGFGGNDSTNQKIIGALGKISTGDQTAENTLKQLLGSNEKVAAAIEENTANDKSSEVKSLSIFSSMKELLISGNKIARDQTEQLKRDKAFERNIKQRMSEAGGGQSEAEARLSASFDTVSSDFKEAKNNITGIFAAIATGYGGVKVVNSMIREGADQRFDMAQEIRQSGLMAGMDTAAAGLVNLSKTISGANFTFGEAQQFTQQFARAVGVRGVQASLEFANSLADSGDGANMMQKYGMEFREVAEIAGTYMESVRTIGQLDQLSDTQMRSGMDDFMQNVVSTSNTMNVNLQDAANMIKDTLKEDKFASMLALLDGERRETVTALVGKFGGDQTVLGQGIGTALAAGSTQEFLMTEIGQMLQGDVIGQQLIPIITKLADVGRTQGTDAALEMYSQLGPQLQGLIEFGKDNKALVLTNSGNSQMLIAQAAQLKENIDKAAAGEIGLGRDDRTVLDTKEIFRQQLISGETVQNVLIETADVAENLGKLNNVLLERTIQMREIGIGAAEKFGGFAATITTNIESLVKSVGNMALEIPNAILGADEIINANTTALNNLANRISGGIEQAEASADVSKQIEDRKKDLENLKNDLEINEGGRKTLRYGEGNMGIEQQTEYKRDLITKLEKHITALTAYANGETSTAPEMISLRPPEVIKTENPELTKARIGSLAGDIERNLERIAEKKSNIDQIENGEKPYWWGNTQTQIENDKSRIADLEQLNINILRNIDEAKSTLSPNNKIEVDENFSEQVAQMMKTVVAKREFVDGEGGLRFASGDKTVVAANTNGRSLTNDDARKLDLDNTKVNLSSGAITTISKLFNAETLSGTLDAKIKNLEAALVKISESKQAEDKDILNKVIAALMQNKELDNTSTMSSPDYKLTETEIKYNTEISKLVSAVNELVRKL